jgi:hypothetical protein
VCAGALGWKPEVVEGVSANHSVQGLGGLKLQCEGHDVRYRNIWIKELTIAEPNTDF